MSRTSGRPVSAGSGSAPWPGGTAGKRPGLPRQQPLTTAGVLVFAYEPRRYRTIVDNPTGSGNDIQVGERVAKDRNTPASYTLATISPGQTFISDTFRPYPLWLKTAAGAVTAIVRQELVADR